MNPNDLTYNIKSISRVAQSVEGKAQLVITFEDGSQHTVNDVSNLRAPIEATRLVTNEKLTIFKAVQINFSDGTTCLVSKVAR